MKNVLILLNLISSSVFATTLEGSYELENKTGVRSSSCAEQVTVIINDDGVFLSPSKETNNTSFQFKVSENGTIEKPVGLYDEQRILDVNQEMSESQVYSSVRGFTLIGIYGQLTDYMELSEDNYDELHIGVTSKNALGIFGAGDFDEYDCQYKRI